jgi:hypothetical protein
MIWLGIAIGIVIGMVGTIAICCLIGGASHSREEERQAMAEIFEGLQKPLSQADIDGGVK